MHCSFDQPACADAPGLKGSPPQRRRREGRHRGTLVGGAAARLGMAVRLPDRTSMLMNAVNYRESLRRYKSLVFIIGRRIDSVADEPLLAPASPLSALPMVRARP